MRRNIHMKSLNIKLVKEQVRSQTPKSIITVISTQLDRADEARKRINDEGIVVRDMKGSVIPHPAIKIEIDAGKIIADLLAKHKKPAHNK